MPTLTALLPPADHSLSRSFQAESSHPNIPSTWIISAGSSPSVTISTWALPCRSLSLMAKARSLALLRSRMLDLPPHQAKMF